jgi:lipoprotein signal peptidase
MIPMKTLRRRATYLLLLSITIPLGLAWRMAPLGLSPFFFKYGGSVLWAVALYWLVAACVPRYSSGVRAAVAAVIAAALEFSRLWHTPVMDAFRITLAGRILLGRYFSVKNIAAYWIAIGLTAMLDEAVIATRHNAQRRCHPTV